ncbi:hypothetical protein AOLI_G00209240 [Acnodon oligacanthus]
MIDFSSPLTHLLWFHFRAKDRYLLITFSRHAPELGWREDPVLIFLGAQSELLKGIKWLSGRSACPLGPSWPTRPAPRAGELPSQLPPLLRR